MFTTTSFPYQRILDPPLYTRRVYHNQVLAMKGPTVGYFIAIGYEIPSWPVKHPMSDTQRKTLTLVGEKIYEGQSH